nr:DUF4400 domain-containing protein [Acidithiobacillus ferridurans]
MMASFLEEERKVYRFLVGLVLLEFVIILILGTGIPLQAFQHEQARLVSEEFGSITATSIARLTSSMVNTLFIHTGIYRKTVPAVPTVHQMAGLTVLQRAVLLLHSRILAVWGMIWIAIYRSFIWLAWVPVILPFIIAAGWDGLMGRKIGQYQFSFQSAQRHFAGNRATKTLFAALGLLFFFPFPFPPLLIPVWGVLVAGSLRLWFRWLPKRI